MEDAPWGPAGPMQGRFGSARQATAATAQIARTARLHADMERRGIWRGRTSAPCIRARCREQGVAGLGKALRRTAAGAQGGEVIAAHRPSLSWITAVSAASEAASWRSASSRSRS